MCSGTQYLQVITTVVVATANQFWLDGSVVVVLVGVATCLATGAMATSGDR
ncbi:hypothetical protein [Antrihabitans sp. YC2-6]|uniref:hypothetical protein n=1 Tax=Antrihabitans sp. YC2-6 TaxID=2799498 RepID=UPI0018F5F62E|nr:hypothetical protein [Antrihabitans sp. YC2-6]MBJ8347248.1 hypothetical protein [Antrihabitans sp. YC2-6]